MDKEIETPIDLPPIFEDSQLLKVEIKQSSIEGAGMGLFATAPIRCGQFIAEYYGSIIPSKYSFSEPFLMQDKMVYINNNYCVISRSPASRVNDIVKWDPLHFCSPQNQQSREAKQLPDIQGKQRNSSIKLTGKDKAFIKAERDIAVGEELYISYGYEYWEFFFNEAAKTHQANSQRPQPQQQQQ